MQAFSGGAREPESRLVVAALLDFQNLREVGKGGGEGARENFFSPSLPTPFSLSIIPAPSVALSTLPNLPFPFNIQDKSYSAQPK